MNPIPYILMLTLASGDVGPWPGPVSADFCREVIFEVKLLGRIPIERNLPHTGPFTDYIVKAECHRDDGAVS